MKIRISWKNIHPCPEIGQHLEARLGGAKLRGYGRPQAVPDEELKVVQKSSQARGGKPRRRPENDQEKEVTF